MPLQLCFTKETSTSRALLAFQASFKAICPRLACHTLRFEQYNVYFGLDGVSIGRDRSPFCSISGALISVSFRPKGKVWSFSNLRLNSTAMRVILERRSGILRNVTQEGHADLEEDSYLLFK